jgi:C4-dicarboxylate transporter DctM subunit
MVISAMLVTFFGFLFTGIPIFIILTLASLAGIIAWGTIPLEVLPQRLFTGLDSFVLVAIPFFVMVGLIMERSGLAHRMIDFATALIGAIRGGLALANVAACMLFAGVSGAASADAAAVGSVMIPGMIKKKYDPDFTVALTVTASTIGVIIPPSIPMVLYGVLTGASIAELFVAGVIPGFLIGGALMARAYWVSRKRGYPVEARQTWSEVRGKLIAGIAPLSVIAIILSGIIFGVTTYTEAAVLATVYALFLSMVVYRTLGFKDLIDITVRTALMTSVIALLIAGSNVFSWLLTTQQVPQLLSSALLTLSDNKIVILLIMGAIFLLVGTMMDLTPAMLLLVPIFLPTVNALGIDLVQFGLITIVSLAIGLATPPVGVCLAVGLAIHRLPIDQLTRAMLPFFAAMITVLALLILFPPLTLGLVELMR